MFGPIYCTYIPPPITKSLFSRIKIHLWTKNFYKAICAIGLKEQHHKHQLNKTNTHPQTSPYHPDSYSSLSVSNLVVLLDHTSPANT